jgi:hypothetical protein
MDSLIGAAARALAAGDPLAALKCVVLRYDAGALAQPPCRLAAGSNSAEPIRGVLTLANGKNAVAATATDPAGDVSDRAKQILIIDSTPPAAPVITSPAVTDVATLSSPAPPSPAAPSR